MTEPSSAASGGRLTTEQLAEAGGTDRHRAEPTEPAVDRYGADRDVMDRDVGDRPGADDHGADDHGADRDGGSSPAGPGTASGHGRADLVDRDPVDGEPADGEPADGELEGRDRGAEQVPVIDLRDGDEAGNGELGDTLARHPDPSGIGRGGAGLFGRSPDDGLTAPDAGHPDQNRPNPDPNRPDTNRPDPNPSDLNRPDPARLHGDPDHDAERSLAGPSPATTPGGTTPGMMTPDVTASADAEGAGARPGAPMPSEMTPGVTTPGIMTSADAEGAAARPGAPMPGSPTAVGSAPGGSTASGGPAAGVTATGGELLAPADRERLTRRWRDVQVAFVDHPQQAVQEADSLVAELMQQLAQVFAAERRSLEGQWSRGDDVGTEELRVALQRYRSFFQRLLSV